MLVKGATRSQFGGRASTEPTVIGSMEIFISGNFSIKPFQNRTKNIAPQYNFSYTKDIVF